MKKKQFTSLSVIALSLIAASCTTVTKSHTADYDLMYITKQGILQKPLITDLEVAKQRVTITQSYSKVTVTEAKENIMGEFIKQQSCDLIVQPYFTTSSITENEKTTVTVTLTGYAAFYKNIRNFEAKDTSLFFPRGFRTSAATQSQATKLAKPEVASTEKKDGNNGLLGGLLLAGLLSHR
jgi:hypothetical protein